MTLKLRITNALVFFMVFAVVGNALTGLYSFYESENFKNAGYEQFFEYEDVLAQDTYFIGEPIKFQSIRSSNGDFKTEYTDKIFCPGNPKILQHIALSFGSLANTQGAVEDSTWTYGSFTPGAPFVPLTIDTPEENCVIESTIKADVGRGEFKTQHIVGSKTFSIIERE